MDIIPIEDQIMNWNQMIQPPYDKNTVDPYTRTRVILMNGIENNATLTSHAIHRIIKDPEVKRQLALMRRIESQQQGMVNWLNPGDQTILETTVAYEQVAVDLTANLAKNESDPYVKQTLDFALIEDFDHLYRFGARLDSLEGRDPEEIVKGKTEIKPGRPTSIEHRHPDDTMRKHYDKDSASVKTKLNYLTIVSGEQQTELFYKSHGFMYTDDLTRKLYAEIAEIEEQHVTQYGMLGDPAETIFEKMALMQLHEAYNYFSCAQTESDPRIKAIWETNAKMEVGHLMMVNELMNKYENRDIRDVMKVDIVEPLIVFEENKDYVNKVVEEQIDLSPNKMEFMRLRDLPDDWSTFMYQQKVNKGGVPSEDVVKTSSKYAERENAEIYRRVKQQMAERIAGGMKMAAR